MSDQQNQKLQSIISSEIKQKGGLDFAAFMGQCLYHPEHGYYMVDRVRVGKQGDFFTSSSVHSLFGALISRQLVQMWELLGKGDFVVVEQGAGDGHLANDILDRLKVEAPDLYGCLSYCLVEVSPDNRQRQKEQLAEHRDGVHWSTFEELQPFSGCFLSNELIDAMPVHIVEKRDGKLSEVFVVNCDSGFGEELRPEPGHLQQHFDWLGVSPCEGNRGEVNLAAVDWMRKVAGLVEKGFVLTIDYGHPAEELYAPFRRNGTVMCYHKHSANDDPYQCVGEQDITAHVDFTALQKAGSEEGLDVLYFGEQYRFLMALGFVEQLIQLQAKTGDVREAAALRMTLKNLVMPDEGMGSTFKVLVQGKNIGQPELLCRKRIADIPMPAI
jgi:SAM-dependent MidA family methyltransferase